MVTLPEVRKQLVELTPQGHNFVVRVLQHLCEIGLLQVEKSEMGALATNIWIINRLAGSKQNTVEELRQVDGAFLPTKTIAGLWHGVHQAQDFPPRAFLLH